MRQEFYRDGWIIRTTATAHQKVAYPPCRSEYTRPADVPVPTRTRSLVDAEHTNCPHCHQAECDGTRPSLRCIASPTLLRGGQHRPAFFHAPDRPAHACVWGVLFPLAIGGVLGLLVMAWATAPW